MFPSAVAVCWDFLIIFLVDLHKIICLSVVNECKQNTLNSIQTTLKTMKKSTLSILTAVIAFSPLAAFAQDAQTSIQNNTNSAAAVGVGNVIQQNADQLSVQDQLDLGSYGIPSTPDAQTSVQVNANEAAAVGNHNILLQDAAQTNVQDQVDVNQYLPFGY